MLVASALPASNVHADHAGADAHLAAAHVVYPADITRYTRSATQFNAAAHAGTPAHGARATTTSARDSFVIPPAPARAAPRLALEVHTGLTLPLDNHALCPQGAGCVLQAGGGIGVSVERRRPSGFGGFVGYDAWFLDSDSVYELAVQQLLRGGMRYTMPTDYIFHPIFELSLGMSGLGDTFLISSLGAVGQAYAGAETELTETFGVRIGFGVRAFSHSPFRTSRDDVRRGSGGAFSEAAFFEVGLTVM